MPLLLTRYSYDHLHLEALLALYKRALPSRPIHFFVPLGVKALLISVGIDENAIDELDWWKDVTFEVPRPGTAICGSTIPLISPIPVNISKLASDPTTASRPSSAALYQSPFLISSTTSTAPRSLLWLPHQSLRELYHSDHHSRSNSSCCRLENYRV